MLLDARKNARLTQAELAKRIGADKGYISRIERGLTIPTVSTLYRIAAAMGLTVELRPM
ncbi:helix-turn-helix transcriptional regulator [uncultured Parabacteroides sp.]|uniref:helix-turn-helix domain-containing protein n=1 Tax=uncultured Parabacteroides sp. TaxID=512312 RepID=UPI0025D1B21A|nr:helix-turn-helix transcriptional regulator [uncultured Parabacteroides sp.]